MAGAVVSTISALLKDVYLPPVVEQLNNADVLLSRIEKVTDADLVGNQLVTPLHTTRTGGIGARGELAALPTSGFQGFARAVWTLTHQYGRLQVSGVAMAQSKSNIGSFLEVLKAEMDGLKTDLRRDLARQVWGPSDGNTGGNARIAQCGTTTASTTVVLASAEPLRKGHIYPNMVVDIGTAASPASLASAVTVQSVNVAGPSIVISGSAITTSGSNFITRSGNAGNEITSLQDMVATSSKVIGGIDDSQAANSYWLPLTQTSVGALTLDSMNQMANQLAIAGADTSLLLTSFGVRRAYFNLLQSQVRYTEPLKLESGFTGLSFAGPFGDLPLVADRDAKFGNLYFLDEKYIKNLVNEDWHFLQEDGHILKWVIGFDAWEAAMVKRFQLGITRRNVQGVMAGITDATGF